MDDISDLLATTIKDNSIPAMGAAVIKNGEIIAIGASGVRKSTEDTPATINDKWHIGSCTKAMTSALIARLVEKGLLDWNMSVGDFFSKHVNYTVHASWRMSTLLQLLTHSAGAPGNSTADDMRLPPWASTKPATQARLDLVGIILSAPTAYTSGTSYAYSNVSFVIAGALAELVTLSSFEKLMQEEVFTPHGMTNTSFGPPLGDQPWGHVNIRTPIGPDEYMSDNPETLAPAGKVHTTMQDWAKYVIENLEGEQHSTFLLPATYDLLHTDGTNEQQLHAPGWDIGQKEWARSKNGIGKILVHSGSNQRWFANVCLAPELNFAMLTVSNIALSNSKDISNSVMTSLIQKYVHKIERMPV